jgi:hypothetical protein
MNEQSPKCSRCSSPFYDGELALRDHGEWLHVQCAHVLRSDAIVREWQALKRRSQVKIAESRERLL